MDFKAVLKELLTAFYEHNIRYALMGGFALGAWGIPRATVDIDFLVNRDDTEKVHGIMTGMGYECRYRTENVSQYISPFKIFGEVDFLHAFRSASLRMLQRAEDKEIFNGINIRVLKPEDLIGLKVQAIANDERRKNIELSDIESLMAEFGKGLDWPLIEEYFELFGFDELLKELKERYGSAK